MSFQLLQDTLRYEAQCLAWIAKIIRQPPVFILFYLLIYYEWSYNTYIVQEESASKVIKMTVLLHWTKRVYD